MGRYASLLIESCGGIVTLSLNRPKTRNAFDDRMAGELRDAFEALGRDPDVRGIILTGAGSAFCAGADLRWLGRPVSEAQALEDAERLIQMYRAIDECPRPVVARVQGPTFGGGVGLVAVCDVVVTADTATFALSEPRLGLVPAIISPFLLRKVGESQVRRYCLTGERFSASVAKQLNLVHDVVPVDRLDIRIGELSRALLRLAPGAVQETKSLLRSVLSVPEVDRWAICAQANVRARLSEEAQEGLRAFFEKRPPSWDSNVSRTVPDLDGREVRDKT